MLTVTKRFDFAYAHKLPNYDGLCKNLHGHSGILEVTVSGPPKNNYAPEGMVCDFVVLKKIVQEKVLSILDHSYINEIPDEKESPSDVTDRFLIMRRNPTAENMTGWIGNVLFGEFKEDLVRIRFYETPDSYAEWTKDGKWSS